MPEQEYATPETLAAWKSPEPLRFDYTHSEAGLVVRIEGICRNKDRKAIYEAQRHLTENRQGVALICGYEPTDADIIDAAWCEGCVTAPKMTGEQWLKFGAEASIGEICTEAFIASRVMERKDLKTGNVTEPDGVDAAIEELKADPLD